MVRVWVAGKTVIVTHGIYRSALEIKGFYIKGYINPSVYITFTLLHGIGIALGTNYVKVVKLDPYKPTKCSPKNLLAICHLCLYSERFAKTL